MRYKVTITKRYTPPGEVKQILADIRKRTAEHEAERKTQPAKKNDPDATRKFFEDKKRKDAEEEAKLWHDTKEAAEQQAMLFILEGHECNIKSEEQILQEEKERKERMDNLRKRLTKVSEE